MSTEEKAPQAAGNNSEQTTISSTGSNPLTEDRTVLLSKARAFLQLPQIAAQDVSAKRQFLKDRGLNEQEIDVLVRSTPPPAPLIPPRTYPQPPPSNLPTLLLGVARLFSWLAGSSAIIIFVYYRFLMPRIVQSSLARQSLKSHNLSLMRRFTSSLSAFREEQAEAFAILPKSDPFREPPPFAKCSCIEDIQKSLGKEENACTTVSPITLLRCGLADLGKGNSTEEKPTTEDLFRYLEEKFPWLTTESGLTYENALWEILTSCPLFVAEPLESSSVNQDSRTPSRWTYTPPSPPDPSPVLKSLTALKLSLPKDQSSKPSVIQNTLQSLSEVIGYLSTQIYMPYRPALAAPGTPGSLGPLEEQVRREIRALKGLVLNRRSFMPTASRTATTTPPPSIP